MMLEEKHRLETGPESSPPVSGDGGLGRERGGGERGPESLGVGKGLGGKKTEPSP